MRVTFYKACKDNSSTIAWVCFEIQEWNLFLNDCRLMRSANGATWVAFPSRKYTVDGKEKYHNYYCFTGRAAERFQISAKTAIDKYVKEKQENSTDAESNSSCYV